MNYRVTIEAVSEEDKKFLPEPKTVYLDCVLLAGNYDPAELPEQSPQHCQVDPDTIGQINVVLGQGGKCADALHQFMLSLPDNLRTGLMVRAFAEKMGIRTSQTIASMKVEPERGGYEWLENINVGTRFPASRNFLIKNLSGGWERSTIAGSPFPGSLCLS